MAVNTNIDPIPITPGRSEINDIYATALSNLRAVLAGEDATQFTKRQAASKISDIHRHITRLKKQEIEWSKKYIPESYKIGFKQDAKLIERYIGKAYNDTFSKLHEQASMVAIEATAADMNVVSDALEQTYVSYIRRAQIEGARRAVAQNIAGAVIEGQSRETTRKAILDTLKSKVIGGDITVGQVTMNAQSYADLLARTLVRSARTEGTLNRLNENEIDLVIISNTNAIDFCTEYEDQIFSISGQSKKYPKLTARPPFHPNCYSGDTEIYTENGWTNIKDVKVKELCLSINPETKEIEYLPVIMRHVTVPVNRMINFKNRTLDLLVTPDHNMLYSTDWNYKYNKDIMKFTSAESLVNKKSGAFYRSCNWNGENLKTINLGSKTTSFELYVQFMAWYLSEGSTTISCNQVCISQSKKKNKDKYESIHKLLHDIGYNNHSHSEKGFVIQDKDLTEYLKQFGKCNEKFIPKSIKDSNKEMILLFLETYVFGDGHIKKSNRWKNGNFRDGMSLFTVSKRLADDLGELILKAGMRPSFKIQKSKGKLVHHKNGDYIGNYDLWIIRIGYSQYTTLQSIDIQYCEYNDLTYCVELEKYHTLWVRRNGKTCWSGNCTHTIGAFIEEFATNEEIKRGSQFKDADIGKSAQEMARKYPITKTDKRTRIKKVA